MMDMQLLSFDNLAQRVLYRYAFAFADFVPIESDVVSVDAQRACYELFKSMVHGIADDPSSLGLSTTHQDEWLQAHEVLNRRPELYKVRNACQKAFNDLIEMLFIIGIRGEYRDERLIVSRNDFPKLKEKTLTVFIQFLERYGLSIEKGDFLSIAFSKNPKVLDAWRLAANTCEKYPIPSREQVFRFALWIHDDGLHFLESIKTLLGLDDGFFDYVSEKYRAKGYTARYSIDEYSAKYVFAKDIGGLSIEYATLWPTVRFVNNTSIGIKAALEHAYELDTDIKQQLVKFCKPCNDCLGCTKGGKNKQFTVTVSLDAQDYRVCPEFVQMEWYNDDISREKIDFMLELNELQERFGKNWHKKAKGS